MTRRIDAIPFVLSFQSEFVPFVLQIHCSLFRQIKIYWPRYITVLRHATRMYVILFLFHRLLDSETCFLEIVINRRLMKQGKSSNLMISYRELFFGWPSCFVGLVVGLCRTSLFIREDVSRHATHVTFRVWIEILISIRKNVENIIFQMGEICRESYAWKRSSYIFLELRIHARCTYARWRLFDIQLFEGFVSS